MMYLFMARDTDSQCLPPTSNHLDFPRLFAFQVFEFFDMMDFNIPF